MIIEPDISRKFIRINLDRYVNLEFVSESYPCCRVKNVSLAGMFAEGDFQQSVGRSCNIDIVPSDSDSDVRIEGLAKVVRKDEKGIAIKFTSMPYESYIYLQTALLNEVHDPSKNGQVLSEDCPFNVDDELPVSEQTFDFPEWI